MSPYRAATGIATSSRDADQAAELAQLDLDLAEASFVVVDEVHLVHGEHDVRDTEELHDRGVPTGLLDDTLARVEQHDGDVGGGRAGDHVARVLDVTRRVGELEPAPLGHERPVGDVDRDALLALGAQAVGEEREVDVAVAAALARLLDVLHLVDEDLLRVEEQPSDQRRLAVVDRPAGDEADELGVQALAREELGEPLARSTRHASGPPSPPRTPCRPRASRRAR